MRGLYVPFGPALSGYVTRDIENLPATVSPIDGWNIRHFSNPMMLPLVYFRQPQPAGEEWAFTQDAIPQALLAIQLSC